MKKLVSFMLAAIIILFEVLNIVPVMAKDSEEILKVSNEKIEMVPQTEAYFYISLSEGYIKEDLNYELQNEILVKIEECDQSEVERNNPEILQNAPDNVIWYLLTSYETEGETTCIFQIGGVEKSIDIRVAAETLNNDEILGVEEIENEENYNNENSESAENELDNYFLEENYSNSTYSSSTGVTVAATIDEYVGTVGDVCEFLVKVSPRAETPIVKIDDESIVLVTLEDGDNFDGYVYSLKGLKGGSTIISISVEDETIQIPVSFASIDFKLDTVHLEKPVNSTYGFLALITDKTRGEPTVESSNPYVAEVELYNGNDSRGYLYQLKTIKAGTATISVTYYGITRSFDVVVTGGKTELSFDTVKYTNSAGSIYQFLVKANPKGEQPVVYAEDENIAKVTLVNPEDSRGFLYSVEGLKPGNTKIIAELDGEKADFEVNYTEYDYRLDTSKLTIAEGNRYQFLALITNKQGVEPTVNSSDENIATVKLVNSGDSRGYLYQVDAVSKGNTEIKVSYYGTERKFPVVVEESKVSIKLDTKKYVGTVGSKYTFLAKIENATSEPKVYSSDESIVTVSLKNPNDSRGLLYEINGLKEGTAEIFVQIGSKKESFTAEYSSVNYELDTKQLNTSVGKTYGFLAKITDKKGNTPVVKSTNPDVAEVSLTNANDSRGYLYTLKALAVGKTTIEVDYYGVVRSFEVNVSESNTTLTLDTRVYNGTAGDKYTFLAKVSGSSNMPVVQSSDTDIVSVKLKSSTDPRGYLYEIQGKKAGTATITVTVDGKTQSFEAIYKAVSYTLDTNSVTITAGKSYGFLVKIANRNNGLPNVESSNTAVATVSLTSSTDSRGYLYTVKGLAKGTATITVSYYGTTRSFPVKVNSATNLGIDVSAWQGTIDWKQVKNSGVEFAMLRILSGTMDNLTIDAQFYNNIKNATANNIPVGVYRYSYATNVSEARREATMVVNALKSSGYTITYPVAFDIEDEGAQGNLSKSELTAIIKTFKSVIEENGYKFMIYANKYWLENKIDMTQFSQDDVWIAQYRDYTPNLGYQYSGPGRVTIWQYSSRGSVSGIYGDVDMNIGYVSY